MLRLGGVIEALNLGPSLAAAGVQHHAAPFDPVSRRGRWSAKETWGFKSNSPPNPKIEQSWLDLSGGREGKKTHTHMLFVVAVIQDDLIKSTTAFYTGETKLLLLREDSIWSCLLLSGICPAPGRFTLPNLIHLQHLPTRLIDAPSTAKRNKKRFREWQELICSMFMDFAHAYLNIIPYMNQSVCLPASPLGGHQRKIYASNIALFLIIVFSFLPVLSFRIVLELIPHHIKRQVF